SLVSALPLPDALPILPQWNPSDRLQSRLWWGKYASFAAVVGLAFVAPTVGSVAAELEPFKTAISAHFMRAWPYVFYAVILLGLRSEEHTSELQSRENL